MTNPSSAAPAARPAPPVHKLTYTGSRRGLFALFYVNLALTIVTLGIFRFWAKTRGRKYMWQNIRFSSGEFEYTGSGKELFLGFLRVIMLLLLPLLLAVKLIGLVSVTLSGSLFAIVFALLSPSMVFLTRRYRLSRTNWRKIRFEQRGNVWAYAGKAIAGSALNLVTLGYYAPYNAYRLMNYQLNNISYGTLPFRYRGNKAEFTGAYRKRWLIFVACITSSTIIAFGLPIGQAMVRDFIQGFQDAAHHHHTVVRRASAQDALESLFILGLITMWWLATWLFMVWYRLQLFAHIAKYTRLGKMEFRFSPTFWQFARLRFANGLIKYFSLWLLSPFATHRNMRFMCRHLRMRGMPDLAAVRQAPVRDKSGEGLADLILGDALDI